MKTVGKVNVIISMINGIIKAIISMTNGIIKAIMSVINGIINKIRSKPRRAINQSNGLMPNLFMMSKRQSPVDRKKGHIDVD